MTRQGTEIEVEVVEIDGIVPAVPPDRHVRGAAARGDWQDWRQWQGKVTRTDSRWWPLWVVLGTCAMVLVATAGLVVGVVFLILRGFARMLRRLIG